MLKIYGFSKANPGARGHTRDLRVLWALEEMQLPFEVVGMDHRAHDLNTDVYRQLSPLGQIPSIEDDGLILIEPKFAPNHKNALTPFAFIVKHRAFWSKPA